MRKQKPHPRDVVARNKVNNDSYVVLTSKITENMLPADKDVLIADVRDSVNKYDCIRAHDRTFENIQPGVNSRPSFTRKDYEYFRPEEAIPEDYRKIILLCDRAYSQTGIVKNIIDLMGDFAAQGARLTHRDKRKQRFFRKWWAKVKGNEVTERMGNQLARLANVFLRRDTEKITKKNADNMFAVSEVEPEKREIPRKYTFYHPSVIEQVGGALSSFVEEKLYAVKIPGSLRRMILSPRDENEKKIVNQLPRDIIEAAKTNIPYILPPDKTFAYHYKKDDWQPFGLPMLFSVLDDINHLNKLRLADDAALDGIASKIRIFRIGNLEHEIPPTATEIARFQELLSANVGGGTMDLIWGPAVDIIETDAKYEALTEEKYKPTLNAIYTGLGIPPTLTGAYGSSGTTNNFISIQTLVERLNYIRSIIRSFWEQEVRFICKAMGFKTMPVLEFDFMNLGNKEAILALYIQLADRNIVSDEAIQQIYGVDPEVERQRLRREQREREAGLMVPKAGPWYTEPDTESVLRKIALQSGLASPSEVGLELLEKKAGEESVLDKQIKMKTVTNNTGKGAPGQGRPRNVKDSTKRKKKTFRPKSKAAAIYLWAKKAHEEISNILNPRLLQAIGKASFRSATDAELKLTEDIKFGVLSNIEPYSEITEDIVATMLDLPAKSDINKWYASVKEERKAELTADDMRVIQLWVYTALNEGKQ